MMSDAEDFISRLPEQQQRIMLLLHQQLVREHSLLDKIRFKIPFYYGKSWICYLNPIKDKAVELAFTRGNELSNEQGILQASGRKQIMGITLDAISAIPHDAIQEVIQEAILLDEAVPYKSKNAKK